MVEQHCVEACRAFVDQLNELIDAAGSPTLSELRKLSQRLDERGIRQRELAESTTHDILTGKRKRVPDWQWVASFVRSCHAASQQTGVQVEHLGSLNDWFLRWRAARSPRPAPTGRAAATAPPAPVPPAPPAAPPAVLAVSEPPAAPPGENLAPYAARVAAWGEVAESMSALSESTQRDLEVYGRTGVRLLKRTDIGDAHACMRLVVIALLRDRPDEARLWLRRASDAGHPQAPGLVNHPSWHQTAIGLAYQYGCEYESTSPAKISFAMFFYRLAADRGHAKAAYRLAVLHQLKEENWAAATWFKRAADNGHPYAAARFDGLSEQMSQAPWNVGEALPVGVLDPFATEPSSSSSPTGDPPLTLS